jgi:hypothetical protein
MMQTREEIAAKKKIWYRLNKDKHLISVRLWQTNNKERYLKTKKDYYAKNREACIASVRACQIRRKSNAISKTI